MQYTDKPGWSDWPSNSECFIHRFLKGKLVAVDYKYSYCFSSCIFRYCALNDDVLVFSDTYKYIGQSDIYESFHVVASQTLYILFLILQLCIYVPVCVCVCVCAYTIWRSLFACEVCIQFNHPNQTIKWYILIFNLFPKTVCDVTNV